MTKTSKLIGGDWDDYSDVESSDDYNDYANRIQELNDELQRELNDTFDAAMKAAEEEDEMQRRIFRRQGKERNIDKEEYGDRRSEKEQAKLDRNRQAYERSKKGEKGKTKRTNVSMMDRDMQYIREVNKQQKETLSDESWEKLQEGRQRASQKHGVIHKNWIEITGKLGKNIWSDKAKEKGVSKAAEKLIETINDTLRIQKKGIETGGNVGIMLDRMERNKHMINGAIIMLEKMHREDIKDRVKEIMSTQVKASVAFLTSSKPTKIANQSYSDTAKPFIEVELKINDNKTIKRYKLRKEDRDQFTRFYSSLKEYFEDTGLPTNIGPETLLQIKKDQYAEAPVRVEGLTRDGRVTTDSTEQLREQHQKKLTGSSNAMKMFNMMIPPSERVTIIEQAIQIAPDGVILMELRDMKKTAEKHAREDSEAHPISYERIDGIQTKLREMKTREIRREPTFYNMEMMEKNIDRMKKVLAAEIPDEDEMSKLVWTINDDDPIEDKKAYVRNELKRLERIKARQEEMFGINETDDYETRKKKRFEYLTQRENLDSQEDSQEESWNTVFAYYQGIIDRVEPEMSDLDVPSVEGAINAINKVKIFDEPEVLDTDAGNEDEGEEAPSTRFSQSASDMGLIPSTTPIKSANDLLKEREADLVGYGGGLIN
jgi:hypothetical protein